MKIVVIPVDMFKGKKGGYVYNCIVQGADGKNSICKIIARSEVMPLDNKSHTLEVKAPDALFVL